MSQDGANPSIELKDYPHWVVRFFEILPGAAIWIVLILPLVLTFSAPQFVTIFVLVFDLYWLFKSLAFGVIMILGRHKMDKVMGTNWGAELRKMDPGNHWQDIYQTIIMPTHKEGLDILIPSVQSAADIDYDHKKKIFVLAVEGRDAPECHAIAHTLTEKFSDQFFRFIVTEHPDGIVGEIKGKGSNMTWSARKLVKKLGEDNIDFHNVMVTAADADSRFPSQFFNRLTYQYVTEPDPDRCIYQPVATFFNNIWNVPMLTRVLAFGTTFWQLIESVRPYRLISFSTQAVNLQTLIEMDYWSTSIVSEDSRQYFRGFFHFEGDFRTVPMFMPVYMDAIHTGSIKSDMNNLYLQQQRWAWGVEHTPYIFLECIKHKKIPLLDRLAILWRAFEGNFSWATAPYFISVVGWLPLLLNPSFNSNILAFNYHLFTRYILTLTWVGLAISGYMTIKMIPKPVGRFRKRSMAVMVLQWLLTPITTIFFGSIPAIDAQTRLMLGKYMGFRVTPKVGIKTVE